MRPTKFQVNWPFISGEEEKIRFSSWISDRNNFSYFLPISYPDSSYQVSSQLAFLFWRRSEKIDFQDGSHGGHLGFPIGKILAIFYLQVTPMIPTKFQVKWPRGVEGVGF